MHSGVLGNISTGAEETRTGIQNLFLSQNYPNPFRQSTKIEYEIGNMQMVSLRIYDLFGKVIKVLVDEKKPAGKYETDFNVPGVPPGVYVVELRAGKYRAVKKMIIE